MQYRNLGKTDLSVSVLCLGTWAFGNDSWWGHQNDLDSYSVLTEAINKKINFIDTAPVYGRGHSETIIGNFLKKQNLRQKVILATKLGLRWEGRSILHDLSSKRMSQELDDSRKRLQSDYFDLYQVHWPDPDTPIAETASTMNEFYQKGIIKAVGVSNYSVDQMKEFMKYCPLHCLQPQYSMFYRNIEEDIVPFCLENNIAIISYAPLYSGLLTGKFFLDGKKVPKDTNRKMKAKEFEEPRVSINKETLLALKKIADGYNKTLTQLVINWNYSQSGITSSIVGTRNIAQLNDNLGSVDFQISDDDMKKIDEILKNRLTRIENT